MSAINGTDRQESSRRGYWQISEEKDTFRIMVIALSAIVILTAWVLLYLQVDPVPTWFYVFAWYPTLVLLDAVGTRLDGRPTMLWRRSMLYMFLWSPAIWFVFEVANFRLENWYYVSLPNAVAERWAGITLSFATVVPALLLAERLLDAAGLFRRGRGPVLTVARWEPTYAVAAGVGMGGLALALPRMFFPLIWGSAFLVIDPLVFRADPSRSLLGDLSRGYWGRVGRLMVGGMGIGLIWESYNFWARGKWVYTVPHLEDLKIFEMPPFGFLGFPVFALEAWSMYAGLCLLGVAAPLAKPIVRRKVRVTGGLLLALTFTVFTLIGMERRTVSSTVPRLADMPGVSASNLALLRSAGISSPYDLARADPSDLAANSGLPFQDATKVVETARIVTLKGIGNRHAGLLGSLGIETVCELAERDPDALLHGINRLRTGRRPNGPEVEVWVRAARRSCMRQLNLSNHERAFYTRPLQATNPSVSR